jgi:uncharacterized protein (DUF58 family)
MRLRIAIGGAGVLLGLFGVFRLLTQIDGYDLLVLFGWLVAALVIHDGILSPLVVAVGALLARTLPPRARTFVQGALIAGAAVTVIAIPMIYRARSQPRVKAILEQNFGANLATLLAIVAAIAASLYVLRVLRDRQGASARNGRPADDQPAPAE